VAIALLGVDELIALLEHHFQNQTGVFEWIPSDDRWRCDGPSGTAVRRLGY